jgi:hypothetical protein
MVSAVFIQETRFGVALGFLEAFCLRLAAPFGNGFGEVCKEHGHKQDGCDNAIVEAIGSVPIAKQIWKNRQQYGNDEPNFNHEHDRIFDHAAWVQFLKRSHKGTL